MQERSYFVDWIRVLAFCLLIFFHCAMPFVKFGWEIKNAEVSINLSRLVYWLHQWRLPMLFFISGAGISFSLRRRSVLQFGWERVLRLLVPLLFAMFFTIPLQVYFEWLQTGKITSSYWQFYPSVWQFIPYPEGSLTWSHMWFVVYLFVYCMLLLPILLVFKIKSVSRVVSIVSNALAKPVSVVLLAVPLMALFFCFYIKYPEQGSLVDDWFVFLFSFSMVFYGYLLGGNSKFWDTCEKFRHPFLITALACTAILFYGYWWNFTLPKHQDASLYIYGVLNALHIWLLLLALFGYAKKHLNFSNRFLKYATKAVYPFYILHQTLIVAFGYYVVQWPLPIYGKLLILVVLCFLTVWLIYNWLIKPFIIPRVLYGLTPRETKPKSDVNGHLKT